MATSLAPGPEQPSDTAPAGAVVDMLDVVLAERRQAAVALGEGDAVAAASAGAARLLRAHLPPPARPGALPDPVARWLVRARARAGGAGATGAPRDPLVVEGPGGVLVVRLLPAGRPGRHDVLLLEERPAARGRPALAALAALGLSARQAEVLERAARGSTNAEIAAGMGISPRTVQKHLEHVFDRLGVRTRAGAAARAVAAMTVAGVGADADAGADGPDA